MKVVVAAAALEEKVMMPDSMVFGENGQMVIANTTIHDHEKLGWMTFSQMIQKSSNIGAAKDRNGCSGSSGSIAIFRRSDSASALRSICRVK